MLFETKRLLVRRFSDDDTAALSAVLSDPAVMEHIEPPFSVEQTKAFIQNAGLCEPPLVYAVVWKQSGELIGHLIWHEGEKKGTMELGWILRRDFWGRGVAGELTEAALSQTEKPVLLECSPAQLATRRIAERFGFCLAGEEQGLLIFIKGR